MVITKFSINLEKKAEYDLFEWLKIVEDKGAGEILINSIDKDGSKSGYDISLLENVSKNCKIPIIACGGAGKNEDFLKVLSNTNVDAVAAANFSSFRPKCLQCKEISL